jgi:hypothetical protein
MVEHRRASKVWKSAALFRWEENLSALWGNHQALRILSGKSDIYRQLHGGKLYCYSWNNLGWLFYGPKLAWKAPDHYICQNNGTRDTFIASWHQRSVGHS